MAQLPKSNGINITALNRIFDRTTNSYKFLFFQSLLFLIKNNLFKNHTFSFQEIEKGMIKIADYPINVFRLNFGVQDQIAEKLCGKTTNLVKYVPYRLLTPFFEKELKGMPDAQKNTKIEDLSNIGKEYNPIYKINGDQITIYAEWMNYFYNYYSIIEGWSFWHWVNYLQYKNPNAIGLVNKLHKPSIRSSLSHQTKYWKTVLKHQELTCIFSQKPIIESDLSLDHFLPWSFIGHDQLWNLIPISKSVNSSKSDNIPSMDQYLDRFIQLQIQGLYISNKNMTESKWKNQTDDFVIGLNIKFSDLIDNKEAVTERYRETILPLANIAHNMGFRSNWQY